MRGLGRGAFGQVYLVKDKNKSIQIMIKANAMQ